MSQKKTRGALWGVGFVAPFAILFTGVFLVPILVSVWASLHRAVPSSGGLFGGGELVDQFVGLDNYFEIATGSAFWTGMGRVILFGVVQVPIMIGLALLMALLLDSYVVKRVAVYRLGFFLPYAIPGVVAALVWTYIYTPDFSPINELLALVGLDVNFFHPNIILWSAANMTTWTFAGYNMLIFLAALQAIPGDLYEAARLDGATSFQVVTRIKIPMMRNAALLAVLLSIIGTVQLFNEPTVLRAVNPWMGADYTPMMFAYNSMVGQVSPSGSGFASAISVLMALIAGILAAMYTFVQRRFTL